MIGNMPCDIPRNRRKKWWEYHSERVGWIDGTVGMGDPGFVPYQYWWEPLSLSPADGWPQWALTGKKLNAVKVPPLNYQAWVWQDSGYSRSIIMRLRGWNTPQDFQGIEATHQALVTVTEATDPTDPEFFDVVGNRERLWPTGSQSIIIDLWNERLGTDTFPGTAEIVPLRGCDNCISDPPFDNLPLP